MSKPKLGESAFTCPYCGAYSQQTSHVATLICYFHACFGHSKRSKDRASGYKVTICQVCSKEAIWEDEKMIYPPYEGRGTDLTNVPDNLKEDYIEACKVLQLSPKASATLSRRCLQGILRDQGIVKRSLSQEIDEVIENGGLPDQLKDIVDAVRNVGNFSAHPSKDKVSGEIASVEAGEAEWNLEVIEGLFDFYYTQPAKNAERKSALNAKLIALGKKPMK